MSSDGNNLKMAKYQQINCSEQCIEFDCYLSGCIPNPVILFVYV